ncbi:MAG: hypothetical protein AB7N24_08775 [Dehalococcoidia bacterium]
MDELPDALAVEPEHVCIHHWMLGSPVSGMTPGTCRDCGATREFGQTFAPSSYGRPRRK